MSKTEAKHIFEKAERNYEDAKRFIETSKYPEAVDKFHDLIENALKSLLELYEIEYRPIHDVTDVLPKIIKKIPQSDPNFILYSEVVLPPFVVIHKMLAGVRNMTRYNYKGFPSEKIFNESVAKSIHVMIEANYPSLKYWIIDLLYKE